MHEYDAKYVTTPNYKSTVHFNGHGGYTAPDLELPPEKLDWWRDAKSGYVYTLGVVCAVG